LEQLAAALEKTSNTSVRNLDVLPAAEYRQIVEWNDTAVPYAEDLCIHTLFERQVERNPNAIALVHEETQLSYAELNRQANQLAHHLLALGVGPDDRVGIALERSPQMVVALLATLKAGGAYVPLDPDYPAERLSFMLQDSAPAVLLTQSAVLLSLSPSLPAGIAVLALDQASTWDHPAVDNPSVPRLFSHHLAYVIYTSGSTGIPKGVMMPHSALVNLLRWQRQLEQG